MHIYNTFIFSLLTLHIIAGTGVGDVLRCRRFHRLRVENERRGEKKELPPKGHKLKVLEGLDRRHDDVHGCLIQFQ